VGYLGVPLGKVLVLTSLKFLVLELSSSLPNAGDER
jgi:hypothetical protein